jgi:hypothetical protein
VYASFDTWYARGLKKLANRIDKIDDVHAPTIRAARKIFGIVLDV